MSRAYVLALAGAGLLLASLAVGQSMQRETFDGRETLWQRGPASVAVKEVSHILTTQSAHSAPNSEYIRTDAEAATQLDPYVYYSLPTGHADISDDLIVRVWVRSSRPGVCLLARLVLPRERDPNDPGQMMTELVRGEATTESGLWQPLELRRPVQTVKARQQELQIKLGRPVNIADAYIDRVVLNMYTGKGVTEAWVDDLEVGPVKDPPAPPRMPTPAQTTSRSTGPARVPPPPTSVMTPKGSRVAVEYNREQLRVGGRNFLFRGIRYSDTPLEVLHDAGLNTLFVTDKVDPAVYEKAAREGFWLVPAVTVEGADPELIARNVSRFQADDAVLFWYLGGDRMSRELEPFTKAAHAVRSADPQRPLAADVWDGQWAYSRQVDLLSAHRFPLMTSLELPQYRDWLEQRRRLARPGTFFWTWVQTHLQDWFLNTAYADIDHSHFDEPIGPQPEQIRLLTYLALSAGCRGLGFWSDRFLADSHQGHDRLLTLALLNQELTMLEPLLLGVAETPVWVDTETPEVKAAVIRCGHGELLVLPLWLGRGAQYVPGQQSTHWLSITVPAVPNGTTPWLVSPGEVRSLQFKRETFGMKLLLQDFDTSAAIVFTGDNSPNGLLVRWQEQSRKMVRQAAQWSYQLAGEEIAKVEKVQAQLAPPLAPAVPDAAALLAKAREYAASAKAAWDANDYRTCYRDSQRALRPLRILMRAQWQAAVDSMGKEAPPTSSPYAVSFYTLPRHWRFREHLRDCTPGSDKLADGDFERADPLPAGWQVKRALPEQVDGDVRVTAEFAHASKHSLMIQLRPKPAPGGNPNAPPPSQLEPTYLSAVSPAVSLPPGSLVRVSGWMKVDKPITASADGAMLFDSAGGEPLAVRLTTPTKGWQKFVLYRQVPANGVVQVEAALTGFGTVYFDDLKIEPLIDHK